MQAPIILLLLFTWQQQSLHGHKAVLVSDKNTNFEVKALIKFKECFTNMK